MTLRHLFVTSVLSLSAAALAEEPGVLRLPTGDLPRLAEGRPPEELLACSADADCDLTWHVDGSCCDRLCQTDTVYARSFIAELDAQRSGEACQGVICPIASCLPPSYLSTARCVASKCTWVPEWPTPKPDPGPGACRYEGQLLRPWESVSVGAQRCACQAGAMACQRDDLGACFANGAWHPSGTRIEQLDGCNSATCQDGTWTGWTVAACELRIADRVLFPKGKATLSPASGVLLADLAQTLLTGPIQGDVLVVGHADAKEKDADALSMGRCVAVTRALSEGGVPPERLRCEGAGAGKPVGAAPDNRSVTFELAPASAASDK